METILIIANLCKIKCFFMTMVAADDGFNEGRRRRWRSGGWEVGKNIPRKLEELLQGMKRAEAANR